MFLTIYTLIHVAISLVGLVSGLVVLLAMFNSKRLDGWTAVFLWTTVATSVTGFGFPVEHLMPSHIIGALSLLVLALAIYSRYSRRLAGGWRKAYVISAVVALYFNMFVAIVQAFAKVPALKALAPTQAETPFKLTQLVVLLIFIAAGIFATIRFHPLAPGQGPQESGPSAVTP